MTNCLVICLAIVAGLKAVVAQNQHITGIPITVIAKSKGGLIRGTCPSQEQLDTTIKSISNYYSISYIIQQMPQVPQCGDGLWYRVAHLNMSNPSQQCQSTWRKVAFGGIRACARPNSTDSKEGKCPSILYPVNSQYSKVCGRVIGYQFGSPSAFEQGVVNSNETCVEGVSITHGNPREHIWSYAAGSSEQDCSRYNCPRAGGYEPPSNVGNNNYYYCESAYKGPNCYVINRFFPDDPLWDGSQCDSEGTCCTGTNTPP